SVNHPRAICSNAGQDPAISTADVSGNAGTRVLENANERALGIELFETNLANEAFAEGGFDLDHVTAGCWQASRTPVSGLQQFVTSDNADVFLGSAEQTGEVEWLIITLVEDRALLTSADDSGVTDLDVGILSAQN